MVFFCGFCLSFIPASSIGFVVTPNFPYPRSYHSCHSFPSSFLYNICNSSCLFSPSAAVAACCSLASFVFVLAFWCSLNAVKCWFLSYGYPEINCVLCVKTWFNRCVQRIRILCVCMVIMRVQTLPFVCTNHNSKVCYSVASILWSIYLQSIYTLWMSWMTAGRGIFVCVFVCLWMVRSFRMHTEIFGQISSVEAEWMRVCRSD